ncbi:spermatogenesis-associated protein 5-like protein 1 [Apophysomyces sp. BC1034]|nr:spermatogenesis-associated protein 5-like protein 1 [Apophysomyces sp. BC1034]
METMDPAVLRPGRFDERVYISLPNEEQRMAIIQGISNRMPIVMNEEERLQLAKSTVNWSGAELDNLLREAAMVSLRENVHTETITMAHIETAKHRR